MGYKEQFEFWLEDSYFDEATKQELLAIRNDEKEIEDRFYKELGRRGRRGQKQARSKPYKIPYFEKMYPDASKEVIHVLKTTERKMQYQEYDLKREKCIVDAKNNKVTVIPSREDSYERLLDMGVQFEERTPGVEEQLLERMELEQLHKALSFLLVEEEYLIQEIYFHERTECDLAKELGCSQNAINKRKKRILDKLRRLMENL